MLMSQLALLCQFHVGLDDQTQLKKACSSLGVLRIQQISTPVGKRLVAQVVSHVMPCRVFIRSRAAVIYNTVIDNFRTTILSCTLMGLCSYLSGS